MSTIPIYLEMDVAEDVIQVDLDVERTSVEFDLDVIPTVIIPIPEYDGPYTVTPSESAQTLETDGKKMTDDVSIEAIPSDYVGSGIHRGVPTDIFFWGNVAIVSPGYYAEATGYPMQLATYDNNLTADVEPDINVTDGGLIGVSKNVTETYNPVLSDGYAATTDEVPFGILVHGSLQLDTQAGATVTPTEQEQTAVGSQKYTTGEVKVAPIPVNYGKVTQDGAVLSIE